MTRQCTLHILTQSLSVTCPDHVQSLFSLITDACSPHERLKKTIHGICHTVILLHHFGIVFLFLFLFFCVAISSLVILSTAYVLGVGLWKFPKSLRLICYFWFRRLKIQPPPGTVTSLTCVNFSASTLSTSHRTFTCKFTQSDIAIDTTCCFFC